MTTEQLKRIIENQLSDLNMRRISACQRGDVELVFELDKEIVDTQETLGKL